jgi:hypothetical protein
MHTTLQHPTLRRSRLRLPVLLGLVLAFALAAAACSSTSANQPPPGLSASTTQELEGAWETEQARLGRLSAASRVTRVGTSGHYLQRDQPQLVIDTVNQVLSAARRDAAAR